METANFNWTNNKSVFKRAHSAIVTVELFGRWIILYNIPLIHGVEHAVRLPNFSLFLQESMAMSVGVQVTPEGAQGAVCDGSTVCYTQKSPCKTSAFNADAIFQLFFLRSFWDYWKNRCNPGNHPTIWL